MGILTRHDQALTSTFLETEKGSENHMILGKGKILDIPQNCFDQGYICLPTVEEIF